ncbi:Regulatory protein PchR [Gammaproteobacteria bacterium]|nr:Regulatory protein PchR [Gammaproteobacteria bacterium]
MTSERRLEPEERGRLATGRVPDACDRVLFATDDVILGEFRCPASHPDFASAGPINHHVVAFPREAVWIEREDSPRFVADPGVATIYNPRQAYRRAVISADGDRCDWIGMSEPLARGLVRGFNPADAAHNAAFRYPRATVSSDVYLAQRALFGLARSAGADPLDVEERALAILAAVLGAAYGATGGGDPMPVVRDLVEHARAAIMTRLFDNLSVGELAALVSVSPFYLCRTFRAATGSTLHAYRREMRLRTLLGIAATYRGNLSALALQAGFSSHSHFTTAFRRAFGRAPSHVGATLAS